MTGIQMDQIAAMNISFQFFSLDYFLDSIAKIGFSNVDLWTGYPHLLLDEDFERRCRAVRKKCDDQNLKVANVTPKVIGWPLNIADAEEKIRTNAITYLKRAVDAADILGAPSLQLVPGSGLYDQPKTDAWSRAREALCVVADYAGRAGKQLALEAVQIVETNLVTDKSTLFQMISQVDSPYLGAVVDTTHMVKNGETLDDYFDLLGDKIRRVHLNETDQLPWGEGHAPLQVYLNQLNRHHYQGPISIEICSKPHYLHPYAAMKNTYDFVADALRRQLPV